MVSPDAPFSVPHRRRRDASCLPRRSFIEMFFSVMLGRKNPKKLISGDKARFGFSRRDLSAAVGAEGVGGEKSTADFSFLILQRLLKGDGSPPLPPDSSAGAGDGVAVGGRD